MCSWTRCRSENEGGGWHGKMGIGLDAGACRYRKGSRACCHLETEGGGFDLFSIYLTLP